MEDLEYIVKKALMMCDEGGAPDFFKPTFNTKVKIDDCLVATKKDFIPLTNIPSFKICKKTQKPCIPDTKPWTNTWPTKANGQPTLIGRCKCKCSIGGTIEFMTSGQVPLPDDAKAEVKAMQKQAQKELDDSGNGDSVGEAGFVEGMIPVWGSGRDLVNSVQTGDGWGMAINAGFLVWDCASIVAGVFSFGGGTAAMQAGKAGLKASIKAGGKKIAQKALNKLGINSFKKLGKQALKNSIDDVAKKLLKTCVFACFPAGTPIHTENGFTNIEDIEEGDKVWAYDENTGKIALKKVLCTMERKSDHILKIYTEKEIIDTTLTHPFYVNGQWVDASELKAGDKIYTQDHKEIEVYNTEYVYESTNVYNFEVEDWHNYFVGLHMLLVHNKKGRCVSDKLKKTAKKYVDLGLFKHCFVKDTIVKTKNGEKFIQDISIGDIVIAYNVDNNKLIEAVVLNTYRNYTDKTLLIEIDNVFIRCTRKHRFWIPEIQDWLTADSLVEDMPVLTIDGSTKTIKSISLVEESISTFNFEVEGVHNYFVSVHGILVHNMGSSFNNMTPRPTKIYGIVDKTTKEVVYVGKTVQEEGKRFAQHVAEKGLDTGRYIQKTLDKGNWNPFQTAAREQHYIVKHNTKTLKPGHTIKNKISALSKKKFNHFSKIIKCP